MHFTPGLMARISSSSAKSSSTVLSGLVITIPNAQPLEGVGMPSRVFHWEIGGRERPADLSADLGLPTND